MNNIVFTRAARGMSDEDWQLTEKVHKLLCGIKSIHDKIMGVGGWAILPFFGGPVVAAFTYRFVRPLLSEGLRAYDPIHDGSELGLLLYAMTLIPITWFCIYLLQRKVNAKQLSSQKQELKNLYLSVGEPRFSRAVSCIAELDAELASTAKKEVKKITQ